MKPSDVRSSRARTRPSTDKSPSGVENLNDDVGTLASLRERAEHDVTRHQRRIEGITAQVGRPRSLYVILGLALSWVVLNECALRVGWRAIDPPPFSWLQGLVSLCALLMTVTILTTQNRQTRHAEQRAQLELQVNLLAEQKVAKLIALLEELRRDIPTVKDRVDAVAQVMQEPVDPHAILSALEQSVESKDAPRDAAGGTFAPDHPEGAPGEGRAGRR
ncbi:MAG: DUF1003 domain-containing protein [Polyangiaceae bacterium]